MWVRHVRVPFGNWDLFRPSPNHNDTMQGKFANSVAEMWEGLSKMWKLRAGGRNGQRIGGRRSRGCRAQAQDMMIRCASGMKKGRPCWSGPARVTEGIIFHKQAGRVA